MVFNTETDIPSSTIKELKKIIKSIKTSRIECCGIFTHFAVADEAEDGAEFTADQYENFIDAIDRLGCCGIQFSLRHCANSAAIFDKPSVGDLPDVHLDMVRAGVVLYGIAPSGVTRNLPELRPVMALKSVISHIKTIQAGDTVSYGRTYTADAPRVVATVPIGYADGFWRLNGNGNCQMLVREQLCPVIGRVCMDQIMVDVTDIQEELYVGNHAVMLGKSRDAEISAETLGAMCHSFNYEGVCTFMPRVARVYYINGRMEQSV